MADFLERLQAALKGRYEIARELGRGGMAIVYLAEDVRHHRRVAIKVLEPELAATLGAERFLREIAIAAQLQHPHILTLIDSGEANGFLYYVMPYVEGESLRAKLAREGELPIPEAVRILRDVADALAHAHAHNVIHRDIKPDNVLLSGHHAVVTDFGVAKAVSEATGRQQLTTAGVALGTPAYMAPEQAAGDPHVDHRADIYALGVLGYELFTGRPPFTGLTQQQILAAHVTETPEPVARRRDTVPPVLGELVMRCLAKKPADRWQSTEEVLHQLEAMATPSGGITPTAARPAAVEARRRVALPRWAPVVVGLVVVLVALGWLVRGLERRGAGPGRDRPMLVVLPFENLGSQEDQYFADGITEEITSRLARLSGLGVIARTSAIQYKNSRKTVREIGSELRVQYVLEGTVRWDRSGAGESRVRVNPQLIQVSDETHLWAEPYEAVLSNVFQLQAQVAERVAQALNVTLLTPEREALAKRPTQNLEAYDYYLRGKEHWNRRVLGDLEWAEDAARMYERAVALDPGFALAYASLSQAHSALYWYYRDRTASRRSQAKATADRAFALDSTLPEAHLALGYYYYWGFLDYDRALEHFAIAQREQPNNSELFAAIGYVQRRQGRWEEAVTSLTHAAQLDPRDAAIRLDLATTHSYRRDYVEAMRYLDQALALAPDSASLLALKAQTYLLWQGDTAQVRRLMAEAVQAAGKARMVQEMGMGMPVWLLSEDLLHGLDTVTRAAVKETPENYYSFKAAFHRWRRQPERTRTYADSLRLLMEPRVREYPDDAGLHLSLGGAYSFLGRNSDAIREGRRAIELRPHSKDALLGSDFLMGLAVIYVRVGQYDAAIDQLETLLSIPALVSAHSLRLDPELAPLRNHPRFRRLVGGS